jgi:hypothetical protein
MKHGMPMTAVIGACLLAACSPTPTTGKHSNPSTVPIHRSSPSTHESSTTTIAAGRVVRTIPFPASETELFAAYGSALYVVVIPGEPARTLLVERVAADSGTTTLVRVPFAQADYLSSIAVGPDGIYLGTSVIKRFTETSDALLRLDLTTLKPVARTSFPAAVRVMAQGAQVWASIGDGRELRLDPVSLAIKASAQLLPSAAISEGGFLSTPGLGLGSLWALAGTESDLQLMRMDPSTLAMRSKTPVPTSGGLAQLLNGINADTHHVYLTGRGVVGVAATGTLNEPPVIGGGLAAVAIGAQGLLAVTDPPTALERLNYNGRIEARLPLADGGGNLSVGGNAAWLLGNAGQGNGIVQIRIEGR